MIVISAGTPEFHGTLQLAQTTAKTNAAERVELVEYPTDKDGALAFLNGKPLHVARAWAPTKRGGWSEVKVTAPIPATEPAEVGQAMPPQQVVARLTAPGHDEEAEAHLHEVERIRAAAPPDKDAKIAARFAETGIDLMGDEPLEVDPKIEAEAEAYRARMNRSHKPAVKEPR